MMISAYGLGDTVPTSALYPIPQNSVLEYLAAGGMSYSGGLGQVTQANPNAGTYSDINCPTACWWLGNGLDMSTLGQECWPCHNTCLAGTIWDTTNLVCSASPATANQVTPVTAQSPLDITLQTFGQTFSSAVPWLIGGAVLIFALPLLLRR